MMMVRLVEFRAIPLLALCLLAGCLVTPALAQRDSTSGDHRPEVSLAAGLLSHEAIEEAAPVGVAVSAAVSTPSTDAIGLRATLDYALAPARLPGRGVYINAASIVFNTFDAVLRPRRVADGKLAFIIGGGIYRKLTGLYVADPITGGADAGIRVDLAPHVSLEGSIHYLSRRLAGIKWWSPALIRVGL